jgi:5-methylcytosine-specific restriction enzyme A
MISHLTSKKAVLKAIAECEKLGADNFLKKYGFRHARQYVLLHEGIAYDSKAIAAVAYGYQFNCPPLTWGQLTGGKKGVVPALQRMDFEVKKLQEIDNEEGTRHLFEGGAKVVHLTRYERNPQARQQCIDHHGASCYVCSFDFGRTYGVDFARFIHVHHIEPLSATKKRHKVDPKKDLIPICPNCHAVIHSGGKTRPVKEVKALMKKPA